MAKRKRRKSSTLALAEPSLPPVKRGLLGSPRTVPTGIERPPYALTGDPGPSTSSLVRTPDELAAMRRTGAAAAEILIAIGEAVKPGITTDKLDEIAHQESIKRNAYPSPLNYRGFPKSVCTSINEIICHGIPDSRPLQDGDIINVDVTIFREGVHGDTSITLLVGDVDEESRHLVRETRNAMDAGIAAIRGGLPVNVIGAAIEEHATANGLGVVQEFVGHSVGTEFHSGLAVHHYYDRRANTVVPDGCTFTIEPMLTLGGYTGMYVWDDDWTAVTSNGVRTAQFEHTLVATPDGAEILTQTSSGVLPADVFAVD